MLKPYDPDQAQKVVRDSLDETQTAEEQVKTLTDLPPEDLRQVLLGILLGDI